MPKYKRLKWSKHAKKRFAERGMNFDRVHETIEVPDISYPSKDALDRTVYRKKFEDSIYFVVVQEEKHEEATIITVSKNDF